MSYDFLAIWGCHLIFAFAGIEDTGRYMNNSDEQQFILRLLDREGEDTV